MRRDERPKAAPRRSRYAEPRQPAAPAQLRPIAAPAGSAANVRAYSFAASGGRVTEAYGARVRIIRVR
ncbi:hypothetical protein HJG44_07455 [Enterovirga sp. DB1703]|uniref:Uncharacterized protein n=1 Tax=Enterovirga aerilata TaxID=2730920 RepID=A0A849I844_9HYPH|nr:hypothetical protein [Enterovirga sp. DB1703]